MGTATPPPDTPAPSPQPPAPTRAAPPGGPTTPQGMDPVEGPRGGPYVDQGTIIAREREGHVGAREGEHRHRLDRRAGLRGLRPEELAPGGGIEEQPAHGDRRAPLPHGVVHTLPLAAPAAQAAGDLPLPPSLSP